MRRRDLSVENIARIEIGTVGRKIKWNCSRELPIGARLLRHLVRSAEASVYTEVR